MLYIGCHLSAAKGYLNMGKEALAIGANTFAFFTRNPQGGKAKAIDEEDAAEFLKLAAENDFGTLVAHAPYTLNPCSATEKTRDFARIVFADDLARMEFTPNNYYNFHPGSHTGQGVEKGIELICEILNEVIKPEQTTTVLLETMAGKGSEVGSRFEELAAVIAGVKHSEKLGVCMDSCHLYDAGYDVVNDLDVVLDEFDRIVGLDRLKAFHINDSKNPFCSHKDRHEKIGEGALGLDAILRIINHPKLSHLPFILETPNDLDGYAAEIKMLRNGSK